MALKNSRSQTEILESSRIALQNVENNVVIKPLMEDLGYNTAKIAEGKAILEATKSKYNINQTLEDNKLKAYKEFEDVRLNIHNKYAKDRKKAKVIFKRDALVLNELHISGTLPTTYVKWLEVVLFFYNLIDTDANIQAKLETVKITEAYVTNILLEIHELEVFRGNYIEAKGIAQDATKTKNIEFKKLENWMSDFYAIARIALENHPQLLESLGKPVKS